MVFLIHTLVLLGCGGTNEDAQSGDSATGSNPNDTPALHAVLLGEGTLIWSEQSIDGKWILQVDTGTDWIELSAFGDRWWSEERDGDALFRLTALDHSGEPVAVEVLESSATVGSDHQILFDGERAAVDVSYSGITSLPSLSLGLRWESADGPVYLSTDCDCDCACWSDTPIGLTEGVTEPTDYSAEGQLWGSEPTDIPLSPVLFGEIDGETVLMDQSEAVPFVALGHTLAWGDLHAHSNLSYDGCEVVDEDCGERAGDPAADFFANAAELDLDFVALTDHSEWDVYYPSGDPEGAAYDIWPEQLAAVAAAEDGPVLPLLGYEWTWTVGSNLTEESFNGGHKSVVFREASVCDAYRIAAPPTLDTFQKGIAGGLAVSGNDFQANNPIELYASLDQAAKECGETGVLTFFHHTAYELPQATDWTNHENAPDPFYEPLVEIYSEHGSSECMDLSAPGCDWHLKSGVLYVTRGAVQTALSQGHRLGFTAGTDSHDAYPGSAADHTPSCTANMADTDGDGEGDTFICHDWTGGLTGVLMPAGENAREVLFDALKERRTMATSGPRIELRLFVRGSDGSIHLPGATIGPAALPATLVVEGLESALADAGSELLAADLVAADGSFIDVIQPEPGEPAPDLEIEFVLEQGEAAYLRLRIFDETGNEERLWVSPIFRASTD